MKKIVVTLLICLALTPATVWCDWDNLFDRHDSHNKPSTDPQLDFFFGTVLLIVVASGASLFIVGPLLVIWTRRFRNNLLIVFLANLVMYLLSLYLRKFPEGYTGYLRSPGLWYTVFEIALLSLLSFIVVVILDLTQWLVRKIRAAFKKTENGNEPYIPHD